MIKDIDEAGLYTAFRKSKNVESIMNAYKQNNLTQLRIEIDLAMDEFAYSFSKKLTPEQLIEHNSNVEDFEDMCCYDNLVLAKITENLKSNVCETRASRV